MPAKALALGAGDCLCRPALDAVHSRSQYPAAHSCGCSDGARGSHPAPRRTAGRCTCSGRIAIRWIFVRPRTGSRCACRRRRRSNAARIGCHAAGPTSGADPLGSKNGAPTRGCRPGVPLAQGLTSRAALPEGVNPTVCFCCGGGGRGMSARGRERDSAWHPAPPIPHAARTAAAAKPGADAAAASSRCVSSFVSGMDRTAQIPTDCCSGVPACRGLAFDRHRNLCGARAHLRPPVSLQSFCRTHKCSSS